MHERMHGNEKRAVKAVKEAVRQQCIRIYSIFDIQLLLAVLQ